MNQSMSTAAARPEAGADVAVPSDRNNAWKSPWVRAWVGLIGVVLAVNVTMVVLAIATNPGLIRDDYYERGRDVERTIVTRLAEGPQWTMSIDLPADTRAEETTKVRFAVVDKAGQPVQPERVTYYAYRPSDATRDFSVAMSQEAPGRHLGHAGVHRARRQGAQPGAARQRRVALARRRVPRAGPRGGLPWPSALPPFASVHQRHIRISITDQELAAHHPNLRARSRDPAAPVTAVHEGAGLLPPATAPAQTRAPAEACHHCGLPADAGISAEIDGTERRFCCHGCRSVCQAIYAAGLQGFYRRTPAGLVTGPPPEPPKELKLYDLDEVQQGLVVHGEGDVREVSLLVEGIHCAACVWLIEQGLAGTEGVVEARVNLTGRRLRLKWDSSRAKLSDLLARLGALGYAAVPFDPQAAEGSIQRENRRLLYRMAFAAFGAMNLMWISIALYAGADEGEFRRCSIPAGPFTSAPGAGCGNCGSAWTCPSPSAHPSPTCIRCTSPSRALATFTGTRW